MTSANKQAGHQQSALCSSSFAGCSTSFDRYRGQTVSQSRLIFGVLGQLVLIDWGQTLLLGYSLEALRIEYRARLNQLESGTGTGPFGALGTVSPANSLLAPVRIKFPSVARTPAAVPR